MYEESPSTVNGQHLTFADLHRAAPPLLLANPLRGQEEEEPLFRDHRQTSRPRRGRRCCPILRPGQGFARRHQELVRYP